MIPLSMAMPILAASGDAAGIFGSMCVLIPFCLIIPLAVGFQIWMIVEVITKEPAEDKDKIMWILIVLLLGAIGGLVYFFARRPKRKQLYGK